MKEKTLAVVLAAGAGRRMHSDVQKQYLLLKDKPVIYYALKTFQDSFIDEIVLVVGQGETAYCRREIVEKFHFSKVRHIVEGGKERYHSVGNGLKAITDEGYVFIHDGARPFLSEEILRRAYEAVREYQACVVGMPVKDTIKIADDEKFAVQTPPRETLWQIQTPQTFSYPLIVQAYQKILEQHPRGITDDAMVLEYAMHTKVKLIQGSYRNIKITTPEDIVIAEAMMHIQLE